MIKSELAFEDYLAIFRRWWWIVVLGLLLGGGGAYAYLQVATPLYEASTLILVEPQRIPEEYVKSTVSFNVKRQLTTLTHQVLSRTYLEKVLSRYPEVGGPVDAPIEDRIEALKRRIEIKVIGNDAFQLYFTGKSPKVVQEVTDMLASLFIQENLRVREQQADSTAQFLERERQEMKSYLEKLETELREYKEAHIGELPEQLESNLRALDRLQEEAAQLDAGINLLLQQRAEVQKELDERMNELESAAAQEVVDPLQEELESKQAELGALLLKFTDRHPDVVRLREEIHALRARLAERERGSGPRAYAPLKKSTPHPLQVRLQQIDLELARRRNERKSVQEQIAKYQERVENTPRMEQQMAALQRDYNNARSNYLSLLNKQLEARLARNMELRQQGAQFRVLDKARKPTKPVKPNPLKIMILGLGGGGGLGLGIVFLLAFLDRKIRTVEDLLLVSNMKLLGELSRR